MEDKEEKLLQIIAEIFILGKISVQEPDKKLSCAVLAYMKRTEILELLKEKKNG